MPLIFDFKQSDGKMYQNSRKSVYGVFYGIYQEFYFLSVKESFLTVSNIACFCSGESAAK